MAKMIDALDYRADNFEAAPVEEWRIMQVGIAKKSKKLPRFCRPACEYYQPDVDKVCKFAIKKDSISDKEYCEYYIFDTHIVSEGEKVFTILFGTSTINPNEGVAWQVGEKYFREFMGDTTTDNMLEDFYRLIAPPEDGIVI